MDKYITRGMMGFIITDGEVKECEVVKKHGELNIKVCLDDGSIQKVSRDNFFTTEGEAIDMLTRVRNEDNILKEVFVITGYVIIKASLYNRGDSFCLLYLSKNGDLVQQVVKNKYVNNNFENCKHVFIDYNECNKFLENKRNEDVVKQKERDGKLKEIEGSRRKQQDEIDLETSKCFDEIESGEIELKIKEIFMNERMDIDYTPIVRDVLFDSLYNDTLYNSYYMNRHKNIEEYSNEELEEYLLENDVSDWMNIENSFDIYSSMNSTIDNSIDETINDYETDLLKLIIKKLLNNEYSEDVLNDVTSEMWQWLDIESGEWRRYDYEMLKREVDYNKIRER